jgi:hypothetical protein
MIGGSLFCVGVWGRRDRRLGRRVGALEIGETAEIGATHPQRRPPTPKPTPRPASRTLTPTPTATPQLTPPRPTSAQASAGPALRRRVRGA